MSGAKNPKGAVRKGKDKKDEFPSQEEEISLQVQHLHLENLSSDRLYHLGDNMTRYTCHPDYVFPMVLTYATQEIFGCRADEDVTGDKPHKLLRKEDIIQDMKNRAAVSDFSPVKQAVLDYPDEEMLLVFDREFVYGQSFYLVLTVEAKENILRPPADAEEEVEEEEEFSEVMVQKTPEPKPWLSLGSEREVEEESVKDTRPRLRYRFSRVRRHFGAPVCFSSPGGGEVRDSYVEYPSYQDQSFSLRRMEEDSSVQAVPPTRSTSSQTLWKYPRNMCTQYEPRELQEEQKENVLHSTDLRDFLSSVSARFELAIQQNELMDVFMDDWGALGDEESGFGGKVDTHLKEYQSFTHPHYSSHKSISYLAWHPTVSGVIAVSVTENLSFEERINNSTRLLLNPALILFWSFSDPINPQLLLECPDDVYCFEFCPSDPNIIAGGCMNGQVALWDISAHVDRLQGARSGGAAKPVSNANALQCFEDKRQRAPPVVRYCAVSGVESGHRAPITDIQWLPESFEVSRTGTPLENKTLISVQIVTCASDCCVLFWDLRAPRVVVNALTDTRHKPEEKPVENPYGVSSTFKHLDLTWKPLFRVTLPKVDTSGEYSPLKFSLRPNKDTSVATGDRPELPEYSQLRVPSAKHQQQLDDVSTRFYVGTEDGEVVYTDWKLGKDSDSGRLCSPKPTHCFRVHDWLVHTVQRSPFFEDVILTVGGWNFAIWKEGVMTGPIFLSAGSQKRCTAGSWSLTRPGVLYIGKEDGNMEVWDLLEKSHEPSQSQNVTTTHITCIKPWTVSLKQQLLAVSDLQGMLHILQVPWMLRHPAANEKLNVSRYFEKEVERLVYFEKRREMRTREKRELEAEEQRKKMEVVVAVKQVEELEEEAQREYEDYITLEKLTLKDMGLLPQEMPDR